MKAREEGRVLWGQLTCPFVSLLTWDRIPRLSLLSTDSVPAGVRCWGLR